MTLHKTYTVVLADDHDGVREGIKSIIEKGDEFKVIGEATDGKETIKIVRKLVPDLLILDVKLPVLRGEEVAQRLTAEYPNLRILALSSFDNPQYILNMIGNGAKGYLTKDEAPLLLRKAAKEIVRDETSLWISESLKKQTGINISAVDASSPTITLVEHKIIALLKEGKTRQEIAAALEFSPERVERFLQVLMLKFEVDSIEQVIQKMG